MSDWSFHGFGEQFDQHVVRHLPQYNMVQGVVADTARFMLPNGGVLADVGCSTGATAHRISTRNRDRSFTAHMYDLDQSMLDLAEKRLSEHMMVTTHYHQFDAEQDEYKHRDADLTLFMWTLQFLRPSRRTAVLAAARVRASGSGGILVASKVRVPASRFQEIADEMTMDWKSSKGAAPEEIVDKAKSLRGVMVLNTAHEIADQLSMAGWFEPTVLFRWNSWILLGAWALPQGTELY